MLSGHDDDDDAHVEDPSQAGSRSHSLNTPAWLTHHGKLEAPLVHQPNTSHQVEFLEPHKAQEQSAEATEALLDAAMSRLEAKLDLLLAESRARPRDALHPGVGSEEMGIFARERKQRKKGGKKMLHPEAFRSMYMNHGRQISVLDLRPASDPDTWSELCLLPCFLSVSYRDNHFIVTFLTICQRAVKQQATSPPVLGNGRGWTRSPPEKSPPFRRRGWLYVLC